MKNNPMLNHIQSFIRDAELRLRPFVLSGELSKGYIQGYQYKRINERTLSIEGL